MGLDDEYAFSICNSILANSRVKKFDLYTIFRLLTAKKNKIYVDLNKFNVEDQFDEDEKQQIESFINQVNPFFKNDGSKFGFYAKNYKVAKILHEKCQILEKDRQKVSFYKCKFKNSKKMLTIDDFCDNDDKEAMIFYDKQDAMNQIEKFRKIYKFLKIENPIELIGYNKQNEMIEFFEFN